MSHATLHGAGIPVCACWWQGSHLGKITEFGVRITIRVLVLDTLRWGKHSHMEPPQYMCVPVRMCGILWDTDQIDCEWKCREDGRSGHCVLVEPSATNAACACVCGKIGYNPCGVLCSTVWTSLVNTSCSITILDAAQWCHAVQELVSLARATSSPSQDVDSTTHSAHRLSSNHAPDSSGTQTEQHGLYHSTLTSVLDQTDTHTLWSSY